jgi:DNA-binding HxlR family transcriptional regulator
MDERRSKYRDRPRTKCAADMQDAVSVLEGRWKMMILAHLFGETVMRFSDLQRAIPKVSQKMLIQQLRGLEQDGVISRTVYPEVPPKVEYRLTDIGQGLGPVFLALLGWAELRRSKGQKNAAAKTASLRSKQGVQR